MFGRLAYKLRVWIRWFSIVINRIVRFITRDIWLLDEEDFSRWKARLVKDARTVILMLNTFNDQKIGYQITALAYRSMMAVVPAIAIGFYLTDGLGLRDRFAGILMENLGEQRLTDVLLHAADTIATTAESGLFGFISMATFLWIVISLMMTVRRVFNNVWKVEKEQKFWRMIGVIVGITILSPFVVILFFSGTVVYSNVLELLFPSSLELSESLKSFVSWLSFGGISVMALSLMYKYVPGTRVRYRYAVKAALVSGIAFTAVQYLYLETQMMVAKQSAVYGVLAAIPLFMIWLNLGWTLVLYGAELSFAFQNVEMHRISIEALNQMNDEAVRSRRERLQKGMNL